MRRRACRSGSHAFGPVRRSGVGISRSVCKYCGAVEIDLRESDPPEQDSVTASGLDPNAEREIGGPALFGAGKRLSLFEIQHAVDAGLYEVERRTNGSGGDR